MKSTGFYYLSRILSCTLSPSWIDLTWDGLMDQLDLSLPWLLSTSCTYSCACLYLPRIPSREIINEHEAKCQNAHEVKIPKCVKSCSRFICLVHEPGISVGLSDTELIVSTCSRCNKQLLYEDSCLITTDTKIWKWCWLERK